MTTNKLPGMYYYFFAINRFMFLTEIKNVGKPDVEIDVKYSEWDRTVRYGLLIISALKKASYTEKHLIEKIIYMEID
jgi:hypothetical protein